MGHPENIAAGTFNLSDYDREIQWYTNEFPLEQFGLTAETSLGPTPNAATALSKGEEMLSKIYGRDQIKSEYPLNVRFDKKNGVWAVSGSLPQGADGGVALIIFQKDDGRIIAIYHGA